MKRPSDLTEDEWRALLTRSLHCVWIHTAISLWRASEGQRTWASLATEVLLHMSGAMEEQLKNVSQMLERSAAPIYIVDGRK